MTLELTGKRVAVIGLCPTAQAAARLLCQRRADVFVIETGDTPQVRAQARDLRQLGISVRVGATKPSPGHFDLAVASPATGSNADLARALVFREVPVVSELELAARLAQCLCVAITGTNGRSTTASLVDAMLRAAQRRSDLCGGDFQPFSEIVERSRELDFAVLAVDPRQLEFTRVFQPTVAVLLNASLSWRASYPRHDDYLRLLGSVFALQQPFDWAVIQSEALAQLRYARLPVPAKVITFSATTRRADLFLDRALLVSQLPEWSGPLMDLSATALAAPHLAEDVMAAVAVGRALKVPLETMVEVVKRFVPLPGRCACVAEHNGVRFFDDHRAETPDATRHALLAMPVGQPSEPNVILIAGGRDDGADFYDLGPLLARRVKRAILLGESADRLRAAWSLFTPCSGAGTLLEALALAVQGAVAGDVVLWSPACFSRDQFPDHQRAGEVYRNAILTLPEPTNGGPLNVDSTCGTGSGVSVSPSTPNNMPADDLPRDFERENPGAKTRNAVIGNS